MNKLILPIVAAVIVNFSLLAHAADKNHAREIAIAQAQLAAKSTVQVASLR